TRQVQAELVELRKKAETVAERAKREEQARKAAEERAEAAARRAAEEIVAHEEAQKASGEIQGELKRLRQEAEVAAQQLAEEQAARKAAEQKARQALLSASGAKGQWAYELPEELRSPGQPPYPLCVSTDAEAQESDFDTGPVLVRLVESIAGALREQYDVQVRPWTPECTEAVVVRVTRCEQGKRGGGFLKLKPKTVLEVEGEVLSRHHVAKHFYFIKKSSAGEGGSMGALRNDAETLGKQIAKTALNSG
ncbi:MAG: hypothetical protein KGY81_09500, partial [Phycisphaerae bacterium]|nr:hypothetical protein [Phycisphaerae bacterium]